LSASSKCILLLIVLMLSPCVIEVFADEPIGRVRVSDFLSPEQVAPNKVFSVKLDVEYEIRTNASIRAAIFEGMANAGTPLWQSDVALVSGGGDEIWTLNFTAPPSEGTLYLSAYAYYLDNGVWSFYNDTVLGPGFKQVEIKIARYATLQIQLGVPAIEVVVGNLSEKTTPVGSVAASLLVGVEYPVSVPAVLEYQNSTRIVFNGWQDGSNQTQRTLSINGDSMITGSYRTQYLLRVSSTVPGRSYQSWYDAGSNVTLHKFDSVSMGWPLGLFGGRYDFAGWSGDVNSQSGDLSFEMNSPKTINANFSVEYGALLIVPIIIAAGLVGEAVLLILRHRKASQAKSALSTAVAVCSNCGQEIEEDWTHCIHCGAKLVREDVPSADQ
jgi:hypothetical protein